MAEGKQHALAVGITAMSTAEMYVFLNECFNVFLVSKFNLTMISSCRSSVNKGIGVENYHYLNDGLWMLKPMK